MSQCGGKCSYDSYTSRFVMPESAIFYMCAIKCLVLFMAWAKTKYGSGGGELNFGMFGGGARDLGMKIIGILFAPCFIGLVTFLALPSAYNENGI
jgi:hypothetical protein